jgi:hypothetical protein
MAASKSPAKPKTPKLPRTPENVRKKVLEDPNTAQIAKKLGVTLEEYVEQVVHFVMNPKAEPSLYVVEDQDLEALGMPPPDEDEMGRYLIEAVQVANAAGATGFTDAKKKLVTLSETPAAQADEEHSDPRLKAQLEKELKAGRGRKG